MNRMPFFGKILKAIFVVLLPICIYGQDRPSIALMTEGTTGNIRKCEFEYNQMTFQLPKEIKVAYAEIWGGGGAGGYLQGGGAGGYVFLKLDLTLTSERIITYKVGSGGNGAMINASDGQNSWFSIGPVTVTANGGKGSTGVADGGYLIYNRDNNVPWITVIGTIGERGYPNQTTDVSVVRTGETDTIYIYEQGGKGGDAPFVERSGGMGGTLFKKSITEKKFVQVSDSKAEGGATPGGGGGAKPVVEIPFNTPSNAGNGGSGLILIYY
jgi:hypothetical protein